MRKKETPIYFVPEKTFLTFIELVDNNNIYSFKKALYNCNCGGSIIANVGNVKSGKTISCGCKLHKGTPKHGFSNHPLYCVWENMTTRCYNPKNKSYKNYGGRGIKICKDWKESPASFIRWGIENGWAKGLQLDKDIKGGKIYSPKNCIFVTPAINSIHRRSNTFYNLKVKSKHCQNGLKKLEYPPQYYYID